MTTQQTMDDLASLVDEELRGIVAARDVPLYDMMAYHLGWSDAGESAAPAKAQRRLHGVLCLLACKAVGGAADVALPAAAAVDLVQAFTEVHDDVQGGIPQRNGRDAVWWVWGPAQAINTGDGMHALARVVLFQLTLRGHSPDMTFRAVRLLDEASLQACEGRFMDLEAQERIDLSLDDYVRIAHAKAGSLPGCAMRLGAMAGSGSDDDIDALGACGSKLGVAIQLRSDLAEVWPGPENTAPASPEVMNKKKLLPIVYAFERASASEKRRMGELFFKRVLEQDDVVKLRSILEETGVRADCDQMVRRYRDESLNALAGAGISDEGMANIRELVDSLLR